MHLGALMVTAELNIQLLRETGIPASVQANMQHVWEKLCYNTWASASVFTHRAFH